MGECDRLTGECMCEEGFEGASCERRSCPIDEEGKVCSGHGSCMSMKQAAATRATGNYNYS